MTAVRTLEWVVYHEPSFGTSSYESVTELLVASGYVASESKAPGTFSLRETDMDPRTGTRTYDLDVFEDAARPVIDAIKVCGAKKLF